MYRIPDNLDLSAVVGEFATQVRVHRYDLQFTFGPVSFTVESPVDLFRDGERIAHWEGGLWPEPGFFDIMNNARVRTCVVRNDRLIVVELENGIAMHLVNNSDEYESMQIHFEGSSTLWVI